MKKTILPILFLSMLIASCGKASKAEPIVKEAIEAYKAANRSDAVRYLKMKHRLEMAENVYNNYISSYPCSMCNGYGVVYKTDDYGNAVTDDYGNVQLFFCPTCGGSGEE